MVDKSLPQNLVECDRCGYTFKSRLVRKYVTCPYCMHSIPNPNYVPLKPVVV